MSSNFDHKRERRLVLLTAPSLPDAVNSLHSLDNHFVAMLACDAGMADVTEIAALARHLIDAGCSYFCCWGKDCERVHDIFDEECVGEGLFDDSDDTIMTTWHSSDTLEEFITFCLRDTVPTGSFQATTKTTVAIVIDDQNSALSIQHAFDDPAKFLAGLIN